MRSCQLRLLDGHHQASDHRCSSSIGCSSKISVTIKRSPWPGQTHISSPLNMASGDSSLCAILASSLLILMGMEVHLATANQYSGPRSSAASSRHLPRFRKTESISIVSLCGF